MGVITKSKVVVIEKNLIKSDAYLSLRGISPQLIMLFLSKRRLEQQGKKGKKKWVCTNASEIEFTYLEAEKTYGITNPRFTRGIDDLIAKGFLEISHQGGCYRHDKTNYALSDRWQKFGKADFEKSERPKDPVQRGYRKPNRKPPLLEVTNKNVGTYTNEREAQGTIKMLKAHT